MQKATAESFINCTRILRLRKAPFLMMCWIAMNGILPLDVKLGDTCVVTGLGNLGLIVSLLYKQMGLKVIAVDPTRHRAALAREMGIEHVVDCPPENQTEAVMALTGGRGADIAVDASGLSICVETCIKGSGQIRPSAFAGFSAHGLYRQCDAQLLRYPHQNAYGDRRIEPSLSV